jgi:hypothetical protein
MKEIPVSKGYFAIVDDEDFETVNRYKWRIKDDKTTQYAYATNIIPVLQMHRLIMNVPKEYL